MFEPRRYFEGADRRKRIFDNLEILCSPEFEEIFSKLFGGFEDRVKKPRVHSIGVPDRTEEDLAQAKKLRDDFHWSVKDEDMEPYLHDKVYSEEDGGEDDDSSIHDIHDDGDGDSVSGTLKDEPPSIFDMLASGKEFKDIVYPQPKHTEMLDDEEEERDENVKNPFVFIANRLTFLIKTTQPIIWDTSTMATPSEDCIFIAFNQHKNPQLDMRQAAKIAHAVNMDKDIQDEIKEYLEGTDWENIFCAPHIMILNGEDRLGFVFAVTSKEDD